MMTKPKIMFINAIDPANVLESRFPQLGLGYLVSSLRQEFGLDYFEFRIINRDVEENIKKFKPDIIGITSVTQNYSRAATYARIAKRYSLPVIMGGVHISLLPSTLTNDMDVGVLGEGEETIVDFFNLFAKRGHFGKDELENVNGIVFRRDNELIVTKKRNLIQPLDRIPMPTRDLFTLGKTTYMFTSRGCPYRCAFCASSRLWERVRFFSAEYVVNEIKYLVEEYGVKQIEFWDDLFIVSKSRIKQVVELMEKEGILGKAKFTCNARANLVNSEIVHTLKQMNVKLISMGLESGSPSTLAYLKGKSITVNDNANAVKTISKYGIEPYATFIIGSPQETKQDILKTLRFIKESQLAGFDIYVLTPFPGTLVWDYAKARNLVSEDMDWSCLDMYFSRSHSTAIILSEKLTRDELYELFLMFKNEAVKRQLKRFYKNPFKISGMLFRALLRILQRKPVRGL